MLGTQMDQFSNICVMLMVSHSRPKILLLKHVVHVGQGFLEIYI